MPLPPPITALPIETQRAGFYQGFNQFVAVGSKVLIGLLIIWAAVFPDQAGAFLSALNIIENHEKRENSGFSPGLPRWIRPVAGQTASRRHTTI